MRIDFFEEFPDERSFRKIKAINFSSAVYVAARNLREFYRYKEILEGRNEKIDVGWWPILKYSYYISPFSYSSELEKLVREFEERGRKDKLKVMLDLELPFLNKRLFVKNGLSFFRNRGLIKKIFENSFRYNIEILTAEYCSSNILRRKLFELFGVSYDIDKHPHKKIIMMYSSNINENKLEKIKRFVTKRANEYRDNLYIGLGTIASGILRNEPILTSEGLDKDLEFCREIGIKNVVIFRLEGLDKNYMRVIWKYVER